MVAIEFVFWYTPPLCECSLILAQSVRRSQGRYDGENMQVIYSQPQVLFTLLVQIHSNRCNQQQPAPRAFRSSTSTSKCTTCRTAEMAVWRS